MGEMANISAMQKLGAVIYPGCGILEMITIDMMGPLKSLICGIDACPPSGLDAPNPDVYTAAGKKVPLLSMAKTGRPLVLCMGGVVT